MINNPLQRIFSLLQRINPLLQTAQHAAASEGISISIPRETIVRLLDESKDFDEFTHKVRISLITSLIHAPYPDFNTQPYYDGNNAIIEQSGDFEVLRDIEENDMLDTLLAAKLSLFQPDFSQIKKLNKHLEFTAIDITTQEYQNL